MRENELLVKHVTGSSKDKAPDGKEWIDYWEENTGKKLNSTFRCPCCPNKEFVDKTDVVGAHVQIILNKEGAVGEKGITPTCNNCNLKYTEEQANLKIFQIDKDMFCSLPETSIFNKD